MTEDEYLNKIKITSTRRFMLLTENRERNRIIIKIYELEIDKILKFKLG